MVTEIFFPDVSNVGDSSLDIQPGTVVVIAKASEGRTFTDRSYPRFKDQAKAVGAFFVAYHWLWPGNLQEQAQHAFNVVGPTTPLMLDVEEESAPVGVNDIVGFTRIYRSLGGTVSLLYLPHWYWRDHLGQPDLSPCRDLGLLLVASEYRTYDSNDWPTGYGNMAPYQWQYANNFPYGGHPTDFNAVRDDLGGYVGKVGIKDTVATPPQPMGDDLLDHWTTVQRGSTGQAVNVAEGILIANGLPVGSHNGLPDGSFGPVCESSTRELQQRHNILVDGIFGPHTASVGLYGHDYA